MNSGKETHVRQTHKKEDHNGLVKIARNNKPIRKRIGERVGVKVCRMVMALRQETAPIEKRRQKSRR